MTPKREMFEISRDYYQPHELVLDSWWKVALTDYEKLIEKYPFEELLKSFLKPEIKLLDIGCGSGKFPSLLDQKISGDICCLADLLDVSDYCLQTCAEVLEKLDHFIPGQEILSPLENIHLAFPKNPEHYDLIWAIHSFSTTAQNKLKNVLQYLINLLKDDGKLLIYQFSSNYCYYSLRSFYINHYPLVDASEYITAEDIRNILDLLNVCYETVPLYLEHVISNQDNRDDVLEVYLKKEILNNEVDVLNFFKDKLQDYYDREYDKYTFPQRVDLIIVNR